MDLLGDPLTGQAVSPEPEHDSPEVEARPELPAATNAAPAPAFRLVAPLRLNPLVRDALAAAIASMNGHSRAADAITISAGVFVPLEVFKRRRIDIPVVQRSLTETGMLAQCGNARAGAVQHDMGGKQELGFVIRADFVEGLDPSDFAPSA